MGLCAGDASPGFTRVELPTSEQPLEVTRPLRILVVIASPLNFAPLDVEQEWLRIKEGLSDLEKRCLVVVERLEQRGAP